MKNTMLLVTIWLWSLSGSSQVINQVEYFFDNDPGFGEGTQVGGFIESESLDYSFDIIVPSNFSLGFHTLYIRSKDSNNKWSHTTRKLVEVREDHSMAVIVGGEYFIDTDPNFGQGNEIAINQQGELVLQNFEVLTASLSLGFHQLCIRTLDSNGNWSHSVCKNFEVRRSDDKQVAAVEYFFTSEGDIGVNSCPRIAFANPAENGIFIFNIPSSEVPIGIDTLNVRVVDSNEEWSHTALKESNFNILSFIPGTLASCNQTICNGGDPEFCEFVIEADALSAITYQWYRRNGIQTPVGGTEGWISIGGANGTSYDPAGPLVSTTTYACYVTSDNGSGWANGSMQVTVLPVLNYGSLTSGDQTFSVVGDPSIITFGVQPSGSGSFSYQWYYLDGLINQPFGNPNDWNIISNASVSSYNPPAGLTVSRTYACFVTPVGTPDCGDGSWASGVRRITITPVGINENEAEILMKLYPNPFDQQISMDLFANDASYQIADAVGKVCLEGKVVKGINVIDTSSLSTGSYMFIIISDQGRVTKMIVK